MIHKDQLLLIAQIAISPVACKHKLDCCAFVEMLLLSIGNLDPIDQLQYGVAHTPLTVHQASHGVSHDAYRMPTKGLILLACAAQ